MGFILADRFVDGEQTKKLRKANLSQLFWRVVARDELGMLPVLIIRLSISGGALSFAPWFRMADQGLVDHLDTKDITHGLEAQLAITE